MSVAIRSEPVDPQLDLPDRMTCELKLEATNRRKVRNGLPGRRMEGSVIRILEVDRGRDRRALAQDCKAPVVRGDGSWRSSITARGAKTPWRIRTTGIARTATPATNAASRSIGCSQITNPCM